MLDGTLSRWMVGFAVFLQCGQVLSFAEERNRPILVGIIDDAFYLEHAVFTDCLYKNPREVRLNRRDDDGNGAVDDLIGWDFADGDADVRPPPEDRQRFWHGTHLSGVVRAYLDEAGIETERYRILPVKAVPDRSMDYRMTKAYDGLEYAHEMGADIILCSWSSPTLSWKEQQILDRVTSEGTLVVAAAGNVGAELARYPAAHDNVLAVAGHTDLGMRWASSTYGGFVDLSALSVDVEGASMESVAHYMEKSGTSQAAARVAAAAIVLKTRFPELDGFQLRALLLNSATFAQQNRDVLGRFGAGKLNLGGALQGLSSSRPGIFLKSKGALVLDASSNGTYQVGPFSHAEGVRFRWASPPKTLSGRIRVREGGTEAILFDAEIADVDSEFYVSGSEAILEISDVLIEEPLLLFYELEPIRMTNRFCGDPVLVLEETVLEDGSGAESYSSFSDCKWRIRAPKGKRIHLEFLDFDTERLVDKLYVFEGPETRYPIRAIYTGQETPEPLLLAAPEVLLWFVTDGINSGDGWQVAVTFEEATE